MWLYYYISSAAQKEMFPILALEAFNYWGHQRENKSMLLCAPLFAPCGLGLFV